MFFKNNANRLKKTIEDTLFFFSIFFVLEHSKSFLIKNGTLLLRRVLTKNLFAQVFVGNQISKIFQEKIVVIAKAQVCIFLIFKFKF